jgi:hypothetical protein
MKRLLRYSCITSLAACCLISCESKELVSKRDRQAAEIERLRGELALLDEQLQNAGPNRSQELSVAKEKSEAQISEIARLEMEIVELNAKKQTLQSEFAEYQNKYTLR